jgi:Methyltransferase domain
MSKSTISLNKYVSHYVETVQGYLSSLDSRLIAALLSYQHEANIRGNLCEIGVHHGRLFLMLALARREGERAVGIDLFEDDAINTKTQHAGRDRALFANARRLGIDLSEAETIKTSSLDIKPADILKRTGGLIRFFSIDGSHLYRPVENDLRLAEQTLVADGIIAVDDFFNKNWPDVTFATYDFLRRTTAMPPFAITSSKLYLAAPTAAERYKATLARCTDLGQLYHVQILGQDVLALNQSMLNRVCELMRGLVAR